jgi:hypothetical protein
MFYLKTFSLCYTSSRISIPQGEYKMKKTIGIACLLTIACASATASSTSGAGWEWNNTEASNFSTNAGLSIGGNGEYDYLTTCKTGGIISGTPGENGNYQLLNGLNGPAHVTFLDYCFFTDKSNRTTAPGCYFKLSKPVSGKWVNQTVMIDYDKNSNTVTATTKSGGGVTATAISSGITCKANN